MLNWINTAQLSQWWLNLGLVIYIYIYIYIVLANAVLKPTVNKDVSFLYIMLSSISCVVYKRSQHLHDELTFLGVNGLASKHDVSC